MEVNNKEDSGCYNVLLCSLLSENLGEVTVPHATSEFVADG